MAETKLTFQITPGEGVRAYWLTVCDSHVPLVNGKGNVAVESPSSPVLTWWFTGNPGAKLTILGTVGKKRVVEVRDSRIPKGETEGAGSKSFDV